MAASVVETSAVYKLFHSPTQWSYVMVNCNGHNHTYIKQFWMNK